MAVLTSLLEETKGIYKLQIMPTLSLYHVVLYYASDVK